MEKQIRIILTFVDQASAQLAATVAKVQGTTTGLQAGIAKGFSSMTGIVKGAVGQITGFVTGLASHFRWASLFIGTMAVGAGKSMLDMAASVEQTRVAFETLLKSPKEAGDLMDWLTEMSIKTPLLRSGLQESARAFLAYGHPLEQAKIAVMAVTEATSALGVSQERLQRITVSLGQIYKSERVREVEFRELRLQGISVNELLAKSIAEGSLKVQGLGESLKDASGNVRSLSETELTLVKDTVRGIDIAKALEDQMLKTYGGASLKQVKTLSGLISNFGDVFQLVVQRALGISKRGEVEVGGAFDKIRNAAAKLSEFLINNVDKIANFFNKLLSGKYVLEGMAGVFVGMLVPAILSIIGPIVLLGGAIGFLITKSLPKINELAQNFGGWGVILQNLQKIFIQITKIIMDFLTSPLAKAMAVGFAFVWLALQIAAIIPILVNVAIAFGFFAVIGTVINTIVNAFGGWNNILNTLTVTIKNVVSWIGQHKTQLEVIAGIITVVLLPALFQLIACLGAQLVATIWKNITALAEYAIKLGVIIVQSWLSIAAFIAKATALGIATAAFLIHIAITSAYAIATGIATVATWAFNTALVVLTSPITLVILAIVALIAMIVYLVLNWNTLKENVILVWNTIVSTITSAANAIGTKIGEIVQGIKDKFGGIVSAALGWGKDLISNFINGIKSAVKALGGAANWVIGKLGIPAELFKQHGGIVPGPIGAPMPAIVHGGERIVPTGGQTQMAGGLGGGVTININGPVVMDSEERVKDLADRIIRILGRQSELARYGVGVTFS